MNKKEKELKEMNGLKAFIIGYSEGITEGRKQGALKELEEINAFAFNRAESHGKCSARDILHFIKDKRKELEK